MDLRTHVCWTFISENLLPPLISLLQVLVERLSEWCHFLKNTTWFEIMITISRILLEHQCKCCNLIGWAIAHYQSLVCSGLVWLAKLKCFLVSPNFWKHIYGQMGNQIHEKTKRRAFTVSWIKKAQNFRKKMISTHSHKKWLFKTGKTPKKLKTLSSAKRVLGNLVAKPQN